MKKLFGILAVSAFLFASCGGNTETASEEPVAEEPAVEAVVEEQPTECTDTTAEVAEVAENAETEVAA